MVVGNDSQIKGALNKFLWLAKNKFLIALKEELSTTFVEDFMREFSTVYDQLLLSGKQLPQDPTSPENIKTEVMTVVRARLKEAAESISVSGGFAGLGGTINLKAIPKEDLGFLSGGTIDKDYKEPPKNLLFAFYIVGLASDLVFISKEIYEKMGKKTAGNLGRFGEGFLMEGDKYKALLKARTESGKQKTDPLPSYQEVLHPFSGRGPINFFGILENRINLNKYVENAKKRMKK